MMPEPTPEEAAALEADRAKLVGAAKAKGSARLVRRERPAKALNEEDISASPS
jgi:hypothetical protein